MLVVELYRLFNKMNGREKGGNYPKYYTLQQISETTSNQFGKIDASIDKKQTTAKTYYR